MAKKNNKKQKANHHDFKDNFLTRAVYWFRSLSIIKHILVLYLFITLIGSLLLFTPQARTAGHSVSFIDSLFTSASAFSDTGLAVHVTSETWSMFGQAVIAILILIGGIGWFALKVYLFNIIFGRQISYATRMALSTERGSGVIGSTRRLIKVSVSIMFIIIILFSIILTIYFYNVNGSMGGYDTDHITNAPVKGHSTVGWSNSFLGHSAKGDFGLSLRYGIFHSISALNNAGFDIIGGHSIAGFYHNYGLQIIFIILFVIGGIGYPVIYDIYLFIRSRFTKEEFKWSLFSKISMVAYTSITLIGIGATFWIETTAHDKTGLVGTSKNIPSFWHDSSNGTTGDKTMALIFNTMSTRNAGFSTIKMGQLSRATLVIYIILMFIGSAPASTAGGIRTTTIAIVIMGIISKLRSRTKVQAFGKRIPTDTVTRSYIVTVTAFMIVIMAGLITATSLSVGGGVANAGWENWNPVYVHPKSGIGTGTFGEVTFKRYDFTEVLFEVGSAFGTTGLSVGLTPYLSLASKITLILVMFIGQLGISSSLLVWGKRKSASKHYSYTKEDISIG